MSLFSSKPKVPAYQPRTGDITLDRAQFAMTMRTRAHFGAFARSVGLGPAKQALEDAYTESLKRVGPDGYWNFLGRNPGNGVATLKFANADTLSIFIETAMDMFFKMELKHIDDRATYLVGVRGKADSGDLHTQLQARTEPEANYYTPPAPKPQKPGTPAVPARPAALVEQAKGIAWLTHGVTGDTTPFSQAVLKGVTHDGPLPFGPDITKLMATWRVLVPHAPAYRGWNDTAAQQKYPSNIGGVKVLEDVLAHYHARALPARGHNDWYGIALSLLAAVVASQAFTDGNKRMSRYVYVLTLLRGGVPIVVPDGRLGGQLGDML